VSVGLSGNLRDFGIADIFQLIGQQRKTGVLELTSANMRIHLRFAEGAVMAAAPAGGRSGDSDPLGEMMLRCGLLTRERLSKAQSAAREDAQMFSRTVVEHGWVEAQDVRNIEDLLTKDTIFEVLRWESGSFDFRAEELEHQHDPASLLGAEQILMDGLRMIDEWQSFAPLVPAEDAVFQRVGRFESYRDRAKTSSTEQLEQAQRLFALIDGRLSVRRVIDLSRLGTFDGTRILAELVQAALIKPLHPEGVKKLRKHDRAGARRRDRAFGGALAGIAATAVPLALLAVGVFLAQAPRPPDVGPRVEGRSLEWLREAYATRRVRHALDAYRLTRGRWPQSLEDLPARGYLEREALAAPAGRPYYSVNRDDGVVLLAPEY
jgi:hypothetical protein